ESQTEADRRAVIEDVNGILIQADRLSELIDDLSEVIEGVGELLAIGGLGESEAGQIGCNYVIALSKNRNEVAEHVRRRGESVEQQDGRSVPGAGLAIEDAGIADIGVVIVGHATSFRVRNVAGRSKFRLHSIRCANR